VALALYPASGDRSGVIAVLHTLGPATLARGELKRAASYFEERLALSRELGDQASVAGWAASAWWRWRRATLCERGRSARRVPLRRRSAGALRTWSLRSGKTSGTCTGSVVNTRARTCYAEALRLHVQTGESRGLV
jgi:hypothetical protein